MHPLIDLVELISSVSGRLNLPPGNKKVLFEGIQTGKIQRDIEGAIVVYGSKPDNRWRILKCRLLDDVLDALSPLKLDSKANSQLQVSKARCSNRLLIAKMLHSRGKAETSKYLFERTLKDSKKFGFTEIVIECLFRLRHYAALNGQENEFDSFDADLSHYLEIQKAEFHVWGIVSKSEMPYVKSSAPMPELAKAVYADLEIVEKLMNSYQSRDLIENWHRLKIIAAEVECDFRKVIYSCEQFLQWYEIHPDFGSKARIGQINLQCAVAYYHSKQAELGLIFAKRSFALFNEGSLNWFKSGEYVFLMYMFLEKYDDAFSIFKKIIKHKNFQTGNSISVEKWRLYEIYLRLVYDEAFRARSTVFPYDRFGVQNFLQDVPNLSRDKRGYGVLIVIVQYFLLLDKLIKVHDKSLQEHLRNL